MLRHKGQALDERVTLPIDRVPEGMIQQITAVTGCRPTGAMHVEMFYRCTGRLYCTHNPKDPWCDSNWN